MVDLRSDTATRPTAGMRAAIAAAAVGDEQRREDPTVNELEERAAQLLGQDEAIFLPTATMANQIAIRLHTELGDELIGEENCHVFISELGGPAVHSGVVTRGLPGVAGRYSAEQVAPRTACRRSTRRGRACSGSRTPTTRAGAGSGRWRRSASCTRSRSSSTCVPPRRRTPAERGVALGIDAAEIGARFDTVTLCLSKGLGCPLGAILAGDAEVMATPGG